MLPPNRYEEHEMQQVKFLQFQQDVCAFFQPSHFVQEYVDNSIDKEYHVHSEKIEKHYQWIHSRNLNA